jgi:hypothetical protein
VIVLIVKPFYLIVGDVPNGAHALEPSGWEKDRCVVVPVRVCLEDGVEVRIVVVRVGAHRPVERVLCRVYKPILVMKSGSS